jgi:hypothetical protein
VISFSDTDQRPDHPAMSPIDRGISPIDGAIPAIEGLIAAIDRRIRARDAPNAAIAGWTRFSVTLARRSLEGSRLSFERPRRSIGESIGDVRRPRRSYGNRTLALRSSIAAMSPSIAGVG